MSVAHLVNDHPLIDTVVHLKLSHPIMRGLINVDGGPHQHGAILLTGIGTTLATTALSMYEAIADFKDLRRGAQARWSRILLASQPRRGATSVRLQPLIGNW
jgi:hypothetical protein